MITQQTTFNKSSAGNYYNTCRQTFGLMSLLLY